MDKSKKLNKIGKSNPINPIKSLSSLDNMLHTSHTENLEEGIKAALNASNTTASQSTDITNDIITKLSENIKHIFEQNILFSQNILECKNVTEFIDFQRKNFETNYNNTIKLYNDLFQDIQEMTTKGSKNFFTQK